MTAARFSITTPLAIEPAALWSIVSTPAGIADELSPYLRMTFPDSVQALSPDTVPLGEKLCRSWILLFGVLPVEWDDVVLVEIEPGRRFLERSSMASLSLWEHERIVEPTADGCTITDRLEAVPRLPLPKRLVRGVIATLFKHRHRRLALRHGRPNRPPSTARNARRLGGEPLHHEATKPRGVGSDRIA